MIGRITINGLQVDCIVGCLPAERTTPQRLRLDLWVDVETDPAADSDTISDALDYTAVAEQATFILQEARFQLLESAARMLLRHLLMPPAPGERRPEVITAGVTLTKSGVFPHGACPQLTLSAAADAMTWTETALPWGTRHTIDTSRRVRLERLSIAPGQAAPDETETTLRLTRAEPEDVTQWRSRLQVIHAEEAPAQ